MTDTMTIILSVIGVNIALIGILAAIMIWIFNKIDADVKGLATRMDGISGRLDGHAQRIDQLYNMFVDLLKEVKK